MQSGRIKLGRSVFRIAVPLGLILLAVVLGLTTRSLAGYERSPYPLAPVPRFSQRLVLPNESSEQVGQAKVPVELTLRRGETLTQVFAHLGLPPEEAREATNLVAQRVELRAIKAGNRYSAFFNPDRTLASFKLPLAGAGRLQVSRQGGQWRSDWQTFRRTTELRVLSTTLDGSLEASIVRAGGPGALAFRMAATLQWDLDFSKDLRRGDRFEILYEAVQVDGDLDAIGNVVGLVYDNHGRIHEAYRYGDAGVYYDGEGHPLRKLFLRSPLPYSHITSLFSQSRFHPVLQGFRPHYGVDYGAPVGTPVQVTAKGVVLFAGWDGGGGKVLKVQHEGSYVSAYLHLSRFARGIRPGARVRQGDIIAYTGATGLATGPHLDYRVKHRDQWIDPLQLETVRDQPISGAELASFRAWRGALRRGLDSGIVPQPMLAARLDAGPGALPVVPRQPESGPSIPVLAR